MDLISETSYPCLSTSGHEIVIPIPRPPLSPIICLPSVRSQLRESPAKMTLSPMSLTGTGFFNMASTPTLLNSMEKMYKEDPKNH